MADIMGPIVYEGLCLVDGELPPLLAQNGSTDAKITTVSAYLHVFLIQPYSLTIYDYYNIYYGITTNSGCVLDGEVVTSRRRREDSSPRIEK